MSLEDRNAHAVAREGGQRVAEFLRASIQEGFSFEEWSEGTNGFYLEMLKTDLVAMASVIEAQLSKIYGSFDEPVDRSTLHD